MGGHGARGKDWLRAREHRLCLTDTIYCFFVCFFFLFCFFLLFVFCFLVVFFLVPSSYPEESF